MKRACVLVVAVALLIGGYFSAVGIRTLLNLEIRPALWEWITISFVPWIILCLVLLLVCFRPRGPVIVGIQLLLCGTLLLAALLNHGLPGIAAPLAWVYLAAVIVSIAADLIWVVSASRAS